MRALIAAVLLAAAPAIAGTPARHTVVIVRAGAPKPVVIHVDGQPVLHVKLTKLGTTPPPACKTDRRGIVRCAITY